MTERFEYDVAFSFLDADEPLAAAVADRLRGRMEVFIYSERQKELAGKDGVEEFGKVFGSEARVCVVLYRHGWGQTKWTRLEETAIKERALQSGWNFLLVVALDSTQAPVWLPNTKIWYGYERFGIDSLAAVIDARVAEAGGAVREETARKKAARLARVQQAKEERDRLLRTEAGVRLARQHVAELFAYLEEQVNGMRRDSPNLSISFNRRDKDVVGVSTPGRSFTMAWSQQFANSLDCASLFVREIHGPYSFAGRSREDDTLSEAHIHFTIDASDQPGWKHPEEPDRVYSTQGLAERYLSLVVEHANDEPPQPPWLRAMRERDEYEEMGF